MADWGTAISTVEGHGIADVASFSNYFNAIDWGASISAFCPW